MRWNPSNRHRYSRFGDAFIHARDRERERESNERLIVVVQWVLVIDVIEREREIEEQIDIASSTRALIMSPQTYWRACTRESVCRSMSILRDHDIDGCFLVIIAIIMISIKDARRSRTRARSESSTLPKTHRPAIESSSSSRWFV